MENLIKQTFDQIHAEEALKTKTKQAVLEAMKNKKRSKSFVTKRFAAAVSCFVLVFLGIGGLFSYFTPVAAISLDVNPSLEMEINRFDRVIQVTGYQEEGIALANRLKLKNLRYEDAICAVMEEKVILDCIAEGNQLEITVAGNSKEKNTEMQQCIATYTGMEKVHCLNSWDDIREAHEAGLSFGKYRVFLEMQKENPELTLEKVQGMTMKEIRDSVESQNYEEEEQMHMGQTAGNKKQHQGWK